jgi:hypothetical protein
VTRAILVNAAQRLRRLARRGRLAGRGDDVGLPDDVERVVAAEPEGVEHRGERALLDLRGDEGEHFAAQVRRLVDEQATQLVDRFKPAADLRRAQHFAL